MKNRSYLVYALITIFVWSTIFVFTQTAAQDFDAFAMACVRYLIASVGLIILLVLKKSKLPKVKDIPWFLISGGIGFAAYVLLFNSSVKYLNGATCSVITQINPIVTAIFSSILFKEKINFKGWLCIAAAFAGILIMTLWNGVLDVNPGIILMLLAALTMSIYNLTQRKIVREYPAFESTAYSILFGTVFLLGFIPRSIPQMTAASFPGWFSVAYLGLIGSALAYISWTKAISMAERTSDVTNLFFLTPVMTALIGFIVKHEKPGIETWIGGILILSAMVLFRKTSSK